VRRGVRLGVNNRCQLEPLGVLLSQWSTENASPLTQHEIDCFRRHQLSSCDEVPLVLSFLGVEDDNQLALFQGCQSGFDLVHGGRHGGRVCQEMECQADISRSVAERPRPDTPLATRSSSAGECRVQDALCVLSLHRGVMPVVARRVSKGSAGS
jgi:hypothetical protein